MMTLSSIPGTSVQRWVVEHPTLAFPVLYIGWAYLFWIPLLLSDTSVWRWPNLAWFLVGGASPLLAGLGLTALTGGRSALRQLGRRLTDWRRISGRWWLVLLVFWLGFDLVMAGAGRVSGITDVPLNVRWTLFIEPGPLMFVLLLSFVFPLVEEVGLRGYYLETLQKQWGQTASALINGAVWALWHAPFVWFPGYYANTGFQPSLSWWLPMIVCHTLLIAFVYNRTGHSVLAVLVFHGMMNFTGEWLGISPDMYPFMLVGALAAAGGVAIYWNRPSNRE